ncbi:hypothetical protein NC651_011252 [Populus alba x Populus x berolinensis]|nr:hypothetical protein NC651_011252 [Populus alba x Populus x berolinensis]
MGPERSGILSSSKHEQAMMQLKQLLKVYRDIEALDDKNSLTRCRGVLTRFHLDKGNGRITRQKDTSREKGSQNAAMNVSNCHIVKDAF